MKIELKTIEMKCDYCQEKTIYQTPYGNLPDGWLSSNELNGSYYLINFHMCPKCVEKNGRGDAINKPVLFPGLTKS